MNHDTIPALHSGLVQRGGRPPRLDRDDVIDFIFLRPGEREALERLLDELNLQPGDRRNAIDLATEVARQYLEHPVPIGTRLLSRHSPSIQVVVVGTKPSRFMERWECKPGLHRRPLLRATCDGKPLVWTVDPHARRPGISQSPLSDWLPA